MPLRRAISIFRKINLAEPRRRVWGNEIGDKEGVFRITWANEDQNLERCNRNGEDWVDSKDFMVEP